jgi:hypothetical protein
MQIREQRVPSGRHVSFRASIPEDQAAVKAEGLQQNRLPAASLLIEEWRDERFTFDGCEWGEAARAPERSGAAKRIGRREHAIG